VYIFHVYLKWHTQFTDLYNIGVFEETITEKSVSYDV